MNTNADVIRVELTLESSAGTTLKPKMHAHAKDTRRAVWMEGDNTLRYAWDSTRLADQTGTYGTAVIGAPGLTGITPTGGSSGSSSTLSAMLAGIRDSTILKSPYSVSLNTIQPTTSSYIPLILKGAASQAVDLFEVQDSTGTVLSRHDSQGNFYVSRSAIGSNVGLTVQNTDNTNSASGANLLLGVGGGSANDPYIRFNINGATDWSMGPDNSVSDDPFKISFGSSLGTNDFLILDRTGGSAQIINSINNSLSLSIYNTSASTLNHTSLSLTSTGANSGAYTQYVSNAAGHNWTTGMGLTSSYYITLDQFPGNTNNALVIDTSLNVTVPVTLAVTGLQSNSQAIAFVANGTAGAGRIYKTGAGGLVLQGITGSPYDLSILNAAGTALFRNPTGTANLELPAGTVSVLGGDLTVSRASVAGTVAGVISNTDNTSSSSHARLTIHQGGASGGNPYLHLRIGTGGQDWTAAIDHADSDAFKIGPSTSIGTSTALKIEVSGLRVITGASFVVGAGNGNYLRLPRGSTNPTLPVGGEMYFNTADGHIYGHNGSVWVQII